MTALNLIGVLDFYLIATFILSTVLRYRQYRALLGVIFAVPGRWPRLFQLVREHRTVLLTGPTLWPVGVTFGVMAAHTVAYNFAWHTARVTPADLWAAWPALIPAVGFGAAMLWLDYRATFGVWEFDRAALERDLDQAEYWLRSWVAPALRVLTFGYVNPRQMVSAEVTKALTNATRDLNQMMWQWSLQIAMRLLFGLTLWLTWFL